MQPFTTLTAVAAPLPMVNVDTDMIIPKQFLKTIKRTGLGEGLFHEMRTDENGNKKEFVLDHPAYSNAEILIAGHNFGCGSSREHAPWALLDFGIRCIIAPSYADIFYNNCFKNGILPIATHEHHVEKLMEYAQRGANATLTVDLHLQEIQGHEDGPLVFDIDPHRKHCLINGLDDIGLTMAHDHRIDAFETARRDRHPWHDPQYPERSG